MKNGTAFLFPGQGAYVGTVFSELAAWLPEVSEVFGEIDAALEALSGPTAVVSPTLFQSSPPSLEELAANDPEVLQAALYGTSLIVYKILAASGVRPSVLVGHSFGEIAALVSAGAFTVREGATIVAARNAALRAVTDAGGMLALATGTHRASALIELLGEPGLVVAAENGLRQTVVSGPGLVLEKVADIARLAGVTVTRVPSPYPFRNPMLADVATAFHERMLGLRQKPLREAVYSPILERYYTDGDDLTLLLASHLTRPVRFRSAVQHLYSTGTDVFVECGARSALTTLVRKTLPEVTAFSCLSGLLPPAESLKAAVEHLQGVFPEGVPETRPQETSAAPAVSGFRDRRGLVDELTAMYAKAVEYPEDVFTEDVGLEADLGIDSVKQTELLAQVAERYGLPPLTDDFRIGDYRTLGRIADLVIDHGFTTPALV